MSLFDRFAPPADPDHWYDRLLSRAIGQRLMNDSIERHSAARRAAAESVCEDRICFIQDLAQEDFEANPDNQGVDYFAEMATMAADIEALAADDMYGLCDSLAMFLRRQR